MPRWVRLIRTDDLSPGRGVFVEAAGHELAVFHLADPPRFIVIRNACPHAGGNLSAGQLDGTCVTCPWHHWKFDLLTGRCTLSDNARLTCYETRFENGFLFARLLDAPAPSPDLMT
jgi:nitrite reductase/ring-hydroxylating ferredoxin subunit